MEESNELINYSEKDFKKISQEREDLNSKEKQLENEYDKYKKELNLYSNNLSSLNYQLDICHSDIEDIKKSRGFIDENLLSTECEDVINYFFKDIDINSESFAGCSICIKSKYEEEIVKLKKRNVTFNELKDKIKQSFGRENKQDIVFCNKDGEIYLDNLEIFPILFPLSQVAIEGYVPVIYVEDKTIKKFNKEKIEYDKAENKKQDFTLNTFQKFIKYLKDQSYEILFSLVLILLITFWDLSCKKFLGTKETRLFDLTMSDVYKRALEHYKIAFVKNTTMEYDEKYFNVTEFIFMHFSKGLDSQRELNNSKTIGLTRIIQKRSVKNFLCLSNRLKLSTQGFGEDCNNNFEINKKKIFEMVDSNNTDNIIDIDYFTEDVEQAKFFLGYHSYNNEGYYFDVDFSNENISNVINESYWNFIDNETISVMIIFNTYNLQLHSIGNTRLLFIRSNMTWLYYTKVQVINLKNDFDGYLITAIILSILLIGLFILNLKRKKSEIVDISKLKKDLGSITKKHFLRLPNLIEWIFILNHLLFYVTIALRFSFLSVLRDKEEYYKNIKETTGKDEYHDLSKVINLIDNINFVAVINIFFYFIIFVIYLQSFLTEFQVILKAVLGYIKKLKFYILICVFLFIIVAFFVTLYMHCSFTQYVYSDTNFIFCKILQAFFKGSTDDGDYTDSALRYDTSFSTLTNINNSYKNLYDGIGQFGYIVFNLCFYFFIFILIKSVISSFCYLTYRDQYISSLKKEKEMQKQEEALLRKKAKQEEKEANEAEKKRALKEEGITENQSTLNKQTDSNNLTTKKSESIKNVVLDTVNTENTKREMLK